MIYSVVLSDEAAKTLLRVDAKLRARLQKRFRQLAVNPYDPRLSAPLTARPGIRKSRVGDWRILFIVSREEALVQVVTVGARGQVYRD